MAFKTSQLQNIKVCQQCNGYGVLNPKDPIASHKDCPSCTNDGVYISKGNETFIFGIPGYVNYKSRKVHFATRIVLVIIAIFIVLSVALYFLQNG
ncbi:hypothetical protein KC660_03745 [Candidatus Dojkabacteria bacterium]|uniref:Uncharacterized protein n=1 Tax=Candidatus Dojkabacteria bacterium TaxID=2099670 RepID=A0A955L3V8_9BACT|nr:hypothetical protein [Candidatus Dojkabacteria bacterium]